MSDEPAPHAPSRKDDLENRRVMRVYAALAASVLLGLVPNIWFCPIALILFMGTLPAAQAARRKADPAGFTANHMTYVIRTIWIATGLAAVTMAFGSAYLLATYDPSPLQPCVNRILAAAQTGSALQPQLVTPCVNSLVMGNLRSFIGAGAIAGAPVIIYLAWRLARGIDRARKGYRIANVNHWF